MTSRVRWFVLTVLVGGLLVAVLIPTGRFCPAGSHRARQWSYSQEQWFHVCLSDQEPTRGFGFPVGASTDNRIPLRVGAAVGAVLLAWAVATAFGGKAAGARRVPPGWFIVAVFAVVGAAMAFVLSIRQESKCIRTTPGHASCEYKSFLGWSTEPLVVDGGWMFVGFAAGLATGRVVERKTREQVSQSIVTTAG